MSWPLPAFGSKRDALLYAVAVLVTLHALLFFGFPLALVLATWLLLAVWFMFAGGAPAMLTAVSLAVCVLGLNLGIQFSGLERSLYYRPHELLKSTDPEFGDIYRPNTKFSMHMPFGDIEAMEQVGIREPREIAYQTDSLGFRNPADYHGQKLVLVGDSFVVGMADTQPCITTEWLRREHGLDTYNLGFPGDMNDYVHRIRAFRHRYGYDFQVALFVFEGNDFIPYTGRTPPRPGLADRYYDLFRNSSLWRFTRSLYLRGFKWGKKHEGGALVKEIGGQKMAFYSQDLAAVGNRVPLIEDKLRFVAALQAIQPNPVQVFFVPAKYRVYAQWLAAGPLPNEQWQYLQRAAQQGGVAVHDLTPALQQEAARLLPQGQYVYWRDDTHWNCNGMRVAAAEVARTLHPH